MKKIIAYFLLYIIFCMLQFFFGKYLNICGVFPNLILILVVYLGLTRGVVSAEIMGFLFGITWDVFSTDVFGIRTVIFTIIGYFTGKINKNFDKDRTLVQIVIVVLTNVVYWFIFSFIYWVIPASESSSPSFITTKGMFKILATVIMAPIVFSILDRLTLLSRGDT
ncbi:MAG: rod shape-determining protein MreD [Endomicrobium sp.]|jgi:rod shape-determining protein MreD|nr:rod shape-determining protein MreD [Endomicrobium sp.]